GRRRGPVRADWDACWNTGGMAIGASRRPSLQVAPPGRSRRRWPWVAGGAALVAAAALAAAHFAWPSGTVRVNADGLPQVGSSRLAGRVVRVTLRTRDGKAVPIVGRLDGTV